MTLRMTAQERFDLYIMWVGLPEPSAMACMMSIFTSILDLLGPARRFSSPMHRQSESPLYSLLLIVFSRRKKSGDNYQKSCRPAKLQNADIFESRDPVSADIFVGLWRSPLSGHRAGGKELAINAARLEVEFKLFLIYDGF